MNRAAIEASCRPLLALETLYPAACPALVVNFRVPGMPSPAQVPPVTFTASEAPPPSNQIQYSASEPFTPGGQDCSLIVCAPAVRRSSPGLADQLHSTAFTPSELTRAFPSRSQCVPQPAP